MTRGLTTLVTLLVLLAVTAGGALWGWAELTKPLPGSEDAAGCTPVDAAVGEPVYAGQIQVHVLNAGTRTGLADRTLGLFTDVGFLGGTTDNAPDGTDVTTAEIWTSDATLAGVRLVRSRLGKKTPIVERTDLTTAGVTVVVGNEFTKLRKGLASVKATSAESVCALAK